jgi:dTDP-4-dehydrorhamnose 3,5-epimerase
MTFTSTRLPDVLIVQGEKIPDDRGSLEVAWHHDVFKARGLDARIAQFNYVSNTKRGTIRGMHYQLPPFQEAKLVRPIRGAVFDVAVDMRPDSPTFRQWVGVDLKAGQSRMLYLPPGFAHGYQTLADDTEVLYLVSAPYMPSHQAGVRWDDPAVGIKWPLGTPSVIHERDASYAYLA